MLTARESFDKITTSPVFQKSGRDWALSMMRSGFPVADHRLARSIRAKLRAGLDHDPEYRDAATSWLTCYDRDMDRLAEFNARRTTG